jgi:hypothetical protein
MATNMLECVKELTHSSEGHVNVPWGKLTYEYIHLYVYIYIYIHEYALNIQVYKNKFLCVYI